MDVRVVADSDGFAVEKPRVVVERWTSDDLITVTGQRGHISATLLLTPEEAAQLVQDIINKLKPQERPEAWVGLNPDTVRKRILALADEVAPPPTLGRAL